MPYSATSRPDGAPPLLSTKNIPPRERLIFAMDVSSADEAKKLVADFGDSIHFYKLGLQIFMGGGYYDLIQWLRDRGKSVFVDLKFFDVPETVKLAVAQLNGRGVTFATVHGNQEMLKAAAAAAHGLKILAVTVLTSLDASDLRDLGFECSVKDLVLSRARRALEAGCAGVISSGLEAEQLRRNHGDKLLIVSPGVRPVENRRVDDQKRIVTVEEAFLKGADYIVVGRPIRNAPDPRQKAEDIQQSIAQIFEPGAHDRT
ncbi:MAG: orotidine-5'-phosphate decarboxylase [Verrucomicrobia bacterium]|nr:orotidine-5'-phosphate decarboxylase [Verrucomicrobiota bacterium]MDE3099586.1 orotidine-5'-phosphate decarboxylase [Verrucomicrobiota bacterium]